MDVLPLRVAGAAKGRIRSGPLAARGPGPVLWAVASGKGGVGKSVVTSSLAIGLAGTGPRTLAVDLDLGGANLHSLFGCVHARYTLSDVLRGRVPLTQALVDTTVPGVRLLSGARAGLDAANPHHGRKQRLLRDLRGLDVGHVVIDLGAGSHFGTLDLFLAADRRIVVATPERTSIENAYHFVKAAFFRSLREVARDPEVRDALTGVLEQARRDGATPRELVESASRVDPYVGDRLRSRVSAFDIDLVLNRAELSGLRDPGVEMAAASRAELGANLRLVASLQTDSSVPAAVERGVPVMQLFPGSPFSSELRRAVERLIVDEPIPGSSARGRAAAEHEAPPVPEAPAQPSMPAFDGVAPGAHLRACRELLGLSLDDLHDRTCIRLHHLERIEAEQYAELPPDFYLQAYVQLVAEALELPDGARIAASFLARAREWRVSGPGSGPAPGSISREVPSASELVALVAFEPELEDLPVERPAGPDALGADPAPAQSVATPPRRASHSGEWAEGVGPGASAPRRPRGASRRRRRRREV